MVGEKEGWPFLLFSSARCGGLIFPVLLSPANTCGLRVGKAEDREEFIERGKSRSLNNSISCSQDCGRCAS